MSFYPELDGLIPEALINRYRTPYSDTRRVYNEEVDTYYAEVASVIKSQGEDGIKFLKSEVCDADTPRLKGILSALAWPKQDDPDLLKLFLSYLDDQRPMIVAEAVNG